MYAIGLAAIILTAFAIACGESEGPSSPVGAPLPSPTLTPTNTPIPTATHIPTNTPRVANTPVPITTPTFTPTPVLTNTPTPTATPIPKPGDLLWRSDVNSWGLFESRWLSNHSRGMTTVDGVLYVIADRVVALGASTGELLWVQYEGGIPIPNALTVSNSIVYSGTFDHHLYALDASTGELLWRYKTGDSVGPPVVANGVVYFGAQDGHLYAADAITGETLWSYEVAIHWSHLPAAGNGVVYVGSTSVYPGATALHALDANTGSELWSHGTNSDVHSPVVVDGVVYFEADVWGSSDSHLYAIDAATGELLWRYGTDVSSPTVAGGIVYLSVPSALTALDAHDGELLWRIEATEESFTVPATWNSVVYIGSKYHESKSTCRGVECDRRTDRGRLYALDAATGKVLWRYGTQEDSVWGTTVVEGAVYFFSGDTYALEVFLNAVAAGKPTP